MTDEQAIALRPIIEKAAHQIYRKTGGAVDFEDLCGYAWIGAIRALESYDPSRGTLRAYVITRATGAMLDSLREVDHLSRDHRREVREIEAKAAEALAEGKAIPDTAVSAVSLPPMELDGIENAAKFLAGAPLSTSRFEDKDEIRKLLRRARLRRKVSLAIRYHFLEGLTSKQVGARLGTSEFYASELVKEGMERLRRIAGHKTRKKERFGPEVTAKCEHCGGQFTYKIFRWQTDHTSYIRRLRYCGARCRALALKFNRKLPDFEDLRRMYLKEGLSHGEIAEKLGVSRSAVSKEFRRQGFDCRRISQSKRRRELRRLDKGAPQYPEQADQKYGTTVPRVAAILDLRAGGLTYRQIANRYGCHPGTIMRALQRSGHLARKKRISKLPSFEELEALKNAGLNQRQIAERLGCLPATVSNAFRRGREHSFSKGSSSGRRRIPDRVVGYDASLAIGAGPVAPAG